MAEKFEPQEPGIAMQIVSLLEDAGLVNIANGGWTFEQAMFGISFILPDNVIWAIVFASIAYSAMILHWI
ncbi:hypothetical protein J4220_00415 [Candidatus Micrarchaeota archaeon]|nr:hypothetical protein [Candidatus Micrarchaeota archaeon]HIH20297.1 hypothetical protein [Candidatus Micrarchaeota archaeon]